MKILIILILTIPFISFAQIAENQPIKASDIQAIKDKVDSKKKCIRRDLSQTRSSTGFLDSMKIEGLAPNSRYEVTIEAYFNSTSASQHELRVYKDDSITSNPTNYQNTDAVFVTRLRFYNNNNNVVNHIEFGKTKTFTTNDFEDNITVQFSLNSGTTGSVQASGTSIIVCEADDEEDLTGVISF